MTALTLPLTDVPCRWDRATLDTVPARPVQPLFFRLRCRVVFRTPSSWCGVSACFGRLFSNNYLPTRACFSWLCRLKIVFPLFASYSRDRAWSMSFKICSKRRKARPVIALSPASARSCAGLRAPLAQRSSARFARRACAAGSQRACAPDTDDKSLLLK